MSSEIFFYWLFNLLIVLSIIVAVYLILVLYKINKNLSRWDKLSEKLSVSLLELIPTLVNVENVAKVVKSIFELVQKKHHDKDDKVKEEK